MSFDAGNKIGQALALALFGEEKANRCTELLLHLNAQQAPKVIGTFLLDEADAEALGQAVTAQSFTLVEEQAIPFDMLDPASIQLIEDAVSSVD